jgi:hypothetical protein
MLRRCLIGLFALHFLLSVGGFTLHLPASGHAESALTADADGLGSSIQHGLTDDAPDVPDGTLRRLPVARPALAALPTTPRDFQTREDPFPGSPDRPPRQATLA